MISRRRWRLRCNGCLRLKLDHNRQAGIVNVPMNSMSEEQGRLQTLSFEDQSSENGCLKFQKRKSANRKVSYDSGVECGRRASPLTKNKHASFLLVPLEPALYSTAAF